MTFDVNIGSETDASTESSLRLFGSYLQLDCSLAPKENVITAHVFVAYCIYLDHLYSGAVGLYQHVTGINQKHWFY